MMASVPAASLLPAGALSDHAMFRSLSSDSSASSVMSPLALPRSLGPAGYFDQHLSVGGHLSYGPNAPINGVYPLMGAANAAGKPNHPYSPLSPGLSGPPPASQPPQFFSPNLTSMTNQLSLQLRQRQTSAQRSASLSPTRRAAARIPSSGRTRTRSAMVSPSRGVGYTGIAPGSIQEESSLPGLFSAMDGVPVRLDAAGHPRSDSDPTLPESSTHMVELLTSQNGRLREAWEAERKYLQANRERAEEVYKEERALMEAERRVWETERARLLEEIETLRHHVTSLGGSNTLAQPRTDGDLLAPSQHLRGGGWDTSSGSLRSSESSHGNGSSYRIGGVASYFSGQAPLNLGPVHHQQHLPTFVPSHPLDITPAQTAAPATVGRAEELPVPTVDVQEIHPELEGIPIKARAVQQPTFTDNHMSPDGSKLSSGKPSPPIAPESSVAPPKRQNKEQTLQMLAAREADRLVMHAGHTPNHSLSYLPTVVASEIATQASSNGSNTPTPRGEGSRPEDHLGQADQPDEEDGRDSDRKQASIAEAPGEALDAELDCHGGDPEPRFNPHADDVPLKGPLMVRNMPAHDEIFFQRLSDKLEEVSRGEDAVPKALKGLFDQAEEGYEGTLGAGVDGAADDPDKDGGPAKSDEEEEMEIPLKLKKSNNFGAPFGEFRK